MCPDQFWNNRTNFGVIFGPAGPLLVAKTGPAGPIFPPDQIFRDRRHMHGQNSSITAFVLLMRIERKRSG